jgi:hydroxymethylglutaryl-CoA synthase
MQKIGIDKIGFYAPRYFLDLATLAAARNIDPTKFNKHLGQYQMAIPPASEDIVTMAANAADEILTDEDKSKIDTVIFATESGIDFSKAAGIYVHKLLGLPEHCRVIEIKQACYGATYGIQDAVALINYQPQRKVLVLAADIARYELNSGAESSQGAGAVAILMSVNPRLFTIEKESGFVTSDVMDFWRPSYRTEPFINGRYSCEIYLQILKQTWQKYHELSRRNYSDHAGFCYHTPVPNLVERANKYLAHINNLEIADDTLLQNSLIYGRAIGNCYTASLYIGLLSLLENSVNDLSNKRLGMYSYGSGCVGEFFSGIIQPTYKDVLNTTKHQQFLGTRTALSFEEYLNFYNSYYQNYASGNVTIETAAGGKYKFQGTVDHKRMYGDN